MLFRETVMNITFHSIAMFNLSVFEFAFGRGGTTCLYNKSVDSNKSHQEIYVCCCFQHAYLLISEGYYQQFKG